MMTTTTATAAAAAAEVEVAATARTSKTMKREANEQAANSVKTPCSTFYSKE